MIGLALWFYLAGAMVVAVEAPEVKQWREAPVGVGLLLLLWPAAISLATVLGVYKWARS